ncbi:MAG: hypothetical protein ACP5NZ_05270 [Nanobdellota archaeon]
MKNKKERKYEKRTMAFSEIFILVLATIAFSWMIGGDIEEVSAEEGDPCGRVCSGTQVYLGVESASGSCVAGSTVVEYCTDGCSTNGISCKTPGEEGGDDKGGGVPWGEIGVGIGSEVVDVAKDKLFGKEIVQGITTDASKESMYNTLVELEEGMGNTAGEVGKEGGLNAWDWINPVKEGGQYAGEGIGGHIQNVFNTVFWAAVVATIVTIFAKKVASERNAGDMTTVAWAGVGVAFAYAVAVEVGLISSGPVGWIGAVIVAALVGLYVLVGGYRIYSREIFTYKPSLWQPPEGGSECYKCNLLKVKGTNEKACSEYVCHSYGKSCTWVNNATLYETCIQNNTNDRQAPVIMPVKNVNGEDVFANNNYDYKLTQAGVKITYKGLGGGDLQCVPTFDSLLIAFNTSESAECRISTERKEGTSAEVFPNMDKLIEGSASTINHTLPLDPMLTMSDLAAENSGYKLTNGGRFTYYIKCQDSNGNFNNGYYQIEFCVQKSDKQPPEIKATSPANNSYIAYGTQKIDSFKVYTNEPAECKWDTKKQPYSQMAHTFDKCYTTLNNLLDGRYGCNTSLNGAFVYGNNNYYVACVDKPGEAERNAGNAELIVFRGTRRLIITDVKINEKQNNSVIIGPEEYNEVNFSVTTYGGAEEGKAVCMYTSDGKSFTMFNNDGVKDYLTTNTETIYLSNGTYNYSVYCEDVAGNLNTTYINFSVKIDTLPPTVVRAYNDEGYLTLITDEQAKCVYSLSSCIYPFEEGTEMDTGDGKDYSTEHNIAWNTENNLYVKCRDELGRDPGASACSIEVKPFEI